MSNNFWAAESVCAGHPDKICDQISDAVVDAALSFDTTARVAVEAMVAADRISLSGEINFQGELDYTSIAQQVVKELGYRDPRAGFTWESPIDLNIHQQSSDIAVGVDAGGAGDQGIMFGYACEDTPELMPMPIVLAHRLAQRLDEVRTDLSYLRPDGKSEVVVSYENGRPVGVEKVVLAVPHDQSISIVDLKQSLIERVIRPILEKYKFVTPAESKITINGTGSWEWGGPAADTGLTGRKVVIDSYGSASRVGGGAFSGKDPSKVDRSAAYAARWAAKNVVAAGLSPRCEIHLAYVIGQPKPLVVQIETFGLERRPESYVVDFVNANFDFSVESIINSLNLRRPIYRQTATYGHFGRAGFPWEEVII